MVIVRKDTLIIILGFAFSANNVTFTSNYDWKCFPH